MHRIKWLMILILFFSCCYTPALAQKRAVDLPGTEVLKLTSVVDSLQFELYVHLPDGYLGTNKKYPVLFVLDGQWFFPSMYVGYAGQHYDGLVPDLIIVGITWPGDYTASRQRDFTPNPVTGIPNSGNAAKFLAVIKNEIFQLVDSAYRVDENDRALYGTSLGGMFALYTLFHEPSLFKRYIIISPALEWDNGLVFKYEKSFAQKTRSLNAKIFLSSGAYEEAVHLSSPFKRFVSQLKESNYHGLELETMVTERMGHSGSGTVGGILGLQSVYSRPELELGNPLLKRYTGNYVSGTNSLLVTRADHCLYTENGTDKVRLFAETQEKFYMKGFSGSIEFKKDKHERIIGFSLIRNDTTVFYKKVDSK